MLVGIIAILPMPKGRDKGSNPGDYSFDISATVPPLLVPVLHMVKKPRSSDKNTKTKREQPRLILVRTVTYTSKTNKLRAEILLNIIQ